MKDFLACALSAMLAAPVAMSQQPQPAGAAPSGAPLKIIVLQGEGAKNSIRNKTAAAPAVEVRDAQDKPVTGAEVDFQLPPAGPGGSFSGWLRNQTVKTDAKGQAQATGYAPNEEAGRFNIKVTARSGDSTGSIVISQANVWNGTSGNALRSSKSGWWVVLGLAGAAALAGGLYAAKRGDSTSATTTAAVPVTITLGPISVGNPR